MTKLFILIVLCLISGLCHAQYADTGVFYKTETGSSDTFYRFDYNNPYRFPRIEVSLFPLGSYSTTTDGNYAWMFNTNIRIAKWETINANLLYPNISKNYDQPNDGPRENREILAQISWQHLWHTRVVARLRKHIIGDDFGLNKTSLPGRIAEYITKAKIPINILKGIYTEIGYMYYKNNDDEYFTGPAPSYNILYWVPGYSVGMYMVGGGFVRAQNWSVSRAVSTGLYKGKYFRQNYNFRSMKLYLHLLVPLGSSHKEYKYIGGTAHNGLEMTPQPNTSKLSLTRAGFIAGYENQFKFSGTRWTYTMRIRAGVLPYPKVYLPFPEYNLNMSFNSKTQFEYWELAFLLNLGLGHFHNNQVTDRADF